MKKKKEKVLVIVSGYFNPVHSGHISMFREARELGNLFVIVNSDKQVELKGSVPFMEEQERLEIINSIKYVNKAIRAIDEDGTVCSTIKLVSKMFEGYHIIFANGGDRKEGDVPEEKICKELGIEMAYNIGGEKTQSSSWLLERVKQTA